MTEHNDVPHGSMVGGVPRFGGARPSSPEHIAVRATPGQLARQKLARIEVIQARTRRDPSVRAEQKEKDRRTVDGILAGTVEGRVPVVNMLVRERDPERPGKGGRVSIVASPPFFPQSTGEVQPYQGDTPQEDRPDGKNGQVASQPRSDEPVSEEEDAGKVEFYFPAGARGRELSEDQVAKHLDYKVWKRIELNLVASHNPRAEGKQVPDTAGLSVEEDILSGFGGPFSIVTISRQMDEVEIDERVTHARHDADSARNRGKGLGGSESDANKHDELATLLNDGKRQGLFETTLVVGADSEHEAELLCSRLQSLLSAHRAVDTKIHKTSYGSADEAANAQSQMNDKNGITRDVLIQLIPERPENPIRGVRIEHREPYELNIPGADEIPLKKRMELGVIEDINGRRGEKIVINSDTTTEGTGVFGRTGSGKTKLMEAIICSYVLTEGVFGKKKPAIFVNPKATQPGDQEVAQDLSNALEGWGFKVNKIKLGDLKSIAVGLNPLDNGDIPLPQYAPFVKSLLVKSFGMGNNNVEGLATETVDRFMTRAILGDRDFVGIYERFGWDIKTGKPKIPGSTPAIPTMYDLIDVIEEAALAQEYEKGTEAANVVAWVKSIQMRKATGIANTFYEGEPIDISKLFEVKTDEQGNTIAAVTEIDISDAEEGEQALIMGLIALRVSKYLTGHEAELMLVLDEANKLFSGDSFLVNQFEDITTTIRGAHGSIVLGAQDPHLIATRIRNNLKHKFVMATQGKENFETIQGLLPMLSQEQLTDLAKFHAGEVVYAASDMDPVRGHVMNMTRYVKRARPEFNNPVGPPESLTATGKVEYDFTTERKLELDDMFSKGDEGQALTLLGVTIAFNKLCGLDKQVGLNENHMAEEGITFFDKVKALDPKEQNYLIRRAALQVTVAYSEFFNKLAAKGITLDDVYRKIRDEMTGAIDGTADPDSSFDQAFMVDGFDLRLRTRLTQHVVQKQQEFKEALFGRDLSEEEVEMFQTTLPGTGNGEAFDKFKDFLTKVVEDELQRNGNELTPQQQEELRIKILAFGSDEERERVNSLNEELKELNGGNEVQGDTIQSKLKQVPEASRDDMLKIMLVNNSFRDGTLIDRVAGQTIVKAIKGGEDALEDWKKKIMIYSQCIESLSGDLFYDQVNTSVSYKIAEVNSSQQGVLGLFAEQMQAMAATTQQLKEGGGGSDQAMMMLFAQTLENALERQQQQFLEHLTRFGGGPVVDIDMPASRPNGKDTVTVVDFEHTKAVKFLKEMDTETLYNLARTITNRELLERQHDREALGIAFSAKDLHEQARNNARVLYMLKTLRGDEIDFQEIAEVCIPREQFGQLLGVRNGGSVDIEEELTNARMKFVAEMSKSREAGYYDRANAAYEDTLFAALRAAMSPALSYTQVFEDSRVYNRIRQGVYKNATAYIRGQMKFEDALAENEKFAEAFVSSTTGEELTGEAAIQRALTIQRIVTDARAVRIFGEDEVNRIPMNLQRWLRSKEPSQNAPDGASQMALAAQLTEFNESGKVQNFADEMDRIYSFDGSGEGTAMEQLDNLVRLFSGYMNLSADFSFPTLTNGSHSSNAERVNAFLTEPARFRGVNDRLLMERALAETQLLLADGRYEDAAIRLNQLRAAGDLMTFHLTDPKLDVRSRMVYLQAYFAETSALLTKYEGEQQMDIRIAGGDNQDAIQLLTNRHGAIDDMQRDVNNWLDAANINAEGSISSS